MFGREPIRDGEVIAPILQFIPDRAQNAYLVYYTWPKIKWPHMRRTHCRFQGRAMVSRESLAYPEDTILHLLYRAVKNGRHGKL